uniref:B-cell receptor CD22 first Ig-like domain-containing protein n=1 Tax=Oncorhynchus kisutch TaxID=8019 RepID=A0A8C7FRZ9_ONCKI
SYTGGPWWQLIYKTKIDTSSWTAEVPDSVSGLEGSCIVIPCSFNYPEPKIKPSEFTGIWFKDTSEVIYHTDSSNVITDYRGRTELVGNLRQKNCSLRIDPLHSSDKGPFTFRIEIKDYNKASYKDDRVSIAVRGKFSRENRQLPYLPPALCLTPAHLIPLSSPGATLEHPASKHSSRPRASGKRHQP